MIHNLIKNLVNKFKLNNARPNARRRQGTCRCPGSVGVDTTPCAVGAGNTPTPCAVHLRHAAGTAALGAHDQHRRLDVFRDRCHLPPRGCRQADGGRRGCQVRVCEAPPRVEGGGRVRHHWHCALALLCKWPLQEPAPRCGGQPPTHEIVSNKASTFN
jgi:hypothetical protein